MPTRLASYDLQPEIGCVQASSSVGALVHMSQEFTVAHVALRHLLNIHSGSCSGYVIYWIFISKVIHRALDTLDQTVCGSSVVACWLNG